MDLSGDLTFDVLPKHVCVLGKSQLPGNTGQPHRADVHTLIKMIRCGKLAKNDKKDL